MRTRLLGLGPVLVLVVAATLAGWSMTRWRKAAATQDRAVSAYYQVADQVDAIEKLRAHLGSKGSSAVGTRADALAEIADTIAAAGLPDRVLRSLDERNDAALADATLRRQTLQLTLDSITPAQLGVFFGRLHADRPHWTVTRIELSRSRQAQGNHYDATALMVRTYQPPQAVREAMRDGEAMGAMGSTP